MEEQYMNIALAEAKCALDEDEVPIGAILVDVDGKILARNHNKKEQNHCSLDHAELLVIREASRKKHNWRLNNCSLYVTVQPCPMCMSAIKQSRISKLYFGCTNKNVVEGQLSEDIANLIDANIPVQIYSGIEEEKCKELISLFFQKKR